MQKMFSYQNVFYKTDDSDGWNLALITGTKDEVKKKCETHKDWTDFDIRSGGQSANELEDKMNYYPYPDVVHQLTYWVYSQELDKWFINPDEQIPYPEKDGEQNDDISFSYSLEDNDCELNDAEIFDEEDEVYITAEINIETDTQKSRSVVEIGECK